MSLARPGRTVCTGDAIRDAWRLARASDYVNERAAFRIPGLTTARSTQRNSVTPTPAQAYAPATASGICTGVKFCAELRVGLVGRVDEEVRLLDQLVRRVLRVARVRAVLVAVEQVVGELAVRGTCPRRSWCRRTACGTR